MTSYLVSDHEFASPKVDATYMPLGKFLEEATSDEGLFYDAVYIDANSIDSELYSMILESDPNVVFVRDKPDSPDFVTVQVEDWSPQKATFGDRLSQANGLLHKFVLDKSLVFFVVVFVIAVVIACTFGAYYQSLPMIVALVIELFALVLLIYSMGGLVINFLYRMFKGGKQLTENVGGKCQKCQKWGAVKKSTQEILGTEAIQIKQKMEQKNNRGEVISTYEQYIPGTRTFIRQWYVCKECGTRSYRDFHTDTPNI
ncbi:hypothetical protein [uncultured Adlercreutzia sp.]|uniref:hypothetical protein n=1 Tax=uncultured Adlercreutzia sp. TaxID=875803 RepID=UPI0025DCCEEE|nr:hypothetical protein [uncultured Adlercreutzia sp.]